MLALALAALLAAAPPPAPLTPTLLEQRASAHILREFERVGRRAPKADPSLTQAARRLALEALTESPSGAVELLALTEALSDSGGWDPSPRSYVIRAAVLEHVLGTLLARKDLNEEPASHVGVGVAVRGERASLVVLLAQRRVNLSDFPRALAKPGKGQVLCGHFDATPRDAQVYVTQPGGRVESVPLVRDSGVAFCARVLFPAQGRYTVEVVGRGDKGPEVASLFLVDVGDARERDARERLVEPTTVEDARQAVMDRINALRRAHGEQPLSADTLLTRVAQDYSDRMAREGFFAHVAPDGSNLRTRLAAAGVDARTSGENLGSASGPLSAHFGIEHSPGHRGNLLMPQYVHVGIGVSFQTVAGRTQAIVTEVFSSGPPAPTVADPRQDVYSMLATHRASHGLTPLVRNPTLEQLALEHVQRALELDQPRVELPGPTLHERVFAALEQVRSASVDVYVTESPSQLPDSRNLAERKNGLVGVGVVRGDSRTYGNKRYWVVVIYAAPR